MVIFNWIKKLIQKNPNPAYPANFAKVFRSFNDFMEYVVTTDCFDKHYLYFYQGSSNEVKSIIKRGRQGERAIPDINLRYIGSCYGYRNSIMFHDILFLPDQVSDVKKQYASLDHSHKITSMYRSDDYLESHSVKSVVIGCENVYLCQE